jgi:hypothetical protein
MAFLRRNRKNISFRARNQPDAAAWAIVTAGAPRSSHIRIVRASTAFGRNPGDVFIGVLDIAGFAVDAVLGVDHKF